MIDGRSYLVVGGSSGIGGQVVGQLVEAGANVYHAARRPNQTEGVVNIALDVTSDFNQIDGLPGVLDGLVYCPGTINLRPFHALKEKDFLEDFRVNVLGATKVLKASLKPLKSSSKASVVMFSTVAVGIGMGYHASVAASKGAVEGLVKSLASEWLGSSIRVNCIAPSLTNTSLASGLLSSEDKIKLAEDRHPIKAIGQPHDVAAMVLFLLSDNAKWMTGQVINMDGGLASVKLV